MNIKMLLKVFTKNISTETEYGSVEDPLSKHRTGSNETTLVSEIPNITNDENVIIAPGQGNFVKSRHFFIFLLKVNLAMKLLGTF